MPRKAKTVTPKKTVAKMPKNTGTKTKNNSIANDNNKPVRKKVGKAEGKKMTYLEMVTDAIAAMKERTGSSRKVCIAFSKYIL